uniref:Uncharacterized protein n=1 Tax=Glossina pallidipes TaxID=7398 RepID=A0A1B0AIV1_GLOPL
MKITRNYLLDFHKFHFQPYHRCCVYVFIFMIITSWILYTNINIFYFLTFIKRIIKTKQTELEEPLKKKTLICDSNSSRSAMNAVVFGLDMRHHAFRFVCSLKLQYSSNKFDSESSCNAFT